jgi:hypothetical protein
VTASAAYATDVHRAMEQKVAELQAQHQPGSIGLEERLQGLGELSDQHREVAVSAFLLRLFFVAVECLPVMVKLMSSASNGYERELTRALAQQRRKVEAADRVDALPLRLRDLVAEHRLRAAAVALESLEPRTAAPAAVAGMPVMDDEDVIDLRSARADVRRRGAKHLNHRM